MKEMTDAQAAACWRDMQKESYKLSVGEMSSRGIGMAILLLMKEIESRHAAPQPESRKCSNCGRSERDRDEIICATCEEESNWTPRKEE